MEDFAGIIVFFVIIGLIDKLSKASKKGRGAQGGNAAKHPALPVSDAETKEAKPAKAAAQPARAAVSKAVNASEIQQAIRTAAKFAANENSDADIDLTMLAAKQLQKKLRKPKEKTAIEMDAEARTAADKEGCIGGSIAHTQHEGESKAEHDDHMLRAIQPAAQPIQPAMSVQQLRTADLRKAVVMSEILDKPVSMRGRRTA